MTAQEQDTEEKPAPPPEQPPRRPELDEPTTPVEEQHTDRGPAPAEEDEPRELRITVGPIALITAELAAAGSVGVWHVAGLSGLAATAVTAAGGTWWVLHRRWSSGHRSARAGRRARPVGMGRGGGMPGLGGGRRGSRSSAGPRRGGSVLGGRRGRGATGGGGTGRGGSSAGRSASPTRPRPVSAAARKASSRRAAAGQAGRAAAGRAASGASALRRAALAAHGAARKGQPMRAVGQAARAAAGRGQALGPGGRVRRWSAAAGWTLLGWLWSAGYRGGRRITAPIRRRFGRQEEEQPEATRRPRIETTVNRPDYAPSAGTSYGNGTGADPMRTPAPSWVHAAEDFADALARYSPGEGDGAMYQFYADMKYIPDALEAISRGITTLSRRCEEEWPLHPAIAELISALARVQRQMSAEGAGIAPAVERLHSDDLKRNEEPRHNEHMWNPGRGR